MASELQNGARVELQIALMVADAGLEAAGNGDQGRRMACKVSKV
jgi:hypothetical protein